MPRPDDVLEITYAELQATLRKARRQAYRKGEATAVSFLKSVAKLNGSAAPLLKAAENTSGTVPAQPEHTSGTLQEQPADDDAGEYGPLYEALLAAVIEAREIGDDDAVPGLVAAYREHLDGGGAELHKAWDKNKHPRDDQGRFVSRDSIADAKGDPAKEEALRDRVTDPEEREKLDNALAGTTDLGRTKRGQSRHEAGQRRAKKAANHAAASEIADRIAAGTATHADMHDLGDHLEGLTLDKLRALQSRIPTDVRGKRKADVVAALKESLERSAHMKRVGEGAAGVAGRAAADPARLSLAGMMPNRYDVTTADGEVVPAGKGYQRWEGGGKAVGYTAEQAAKVAAGVTADHADRRIAEHERAASAPDIDDVQREYHATIADQLREHKEKVFGGGEKPALETETTPPASTGVAQDGAGQRVRLPGKAGLEVDPGKYDPAKSYAGANGKEPWQMTGKEWEAATSKARGDGMGGGAGPAVGSQRAAAARGQHHATMAELERLRMGLGGIHDPDGILAPQRVTHEAVVAAALAAGKPVPPEALADYPDLAPPPSAPGPGETPDAARRGGVGALVPVGQTAAVATRPVGATPSPHGPNKVVMRVVGEDGSHLGDLVAAHDGTDEGKKRAGDYLTNEAAMQFGDDFSNMNSKTAVTDDEGYPTHILSPNRQNLNPIDSDAGKYTWGDLRYSPEARARREAERTLPGGQSAPPSALPAAKKPRSAKSKPADPATAHAATLPADSPARGKPPAWVSADPQHAAAADHYGRATGAAKTVLETALDNAGYLRRDPKTDAVTGFERNAPDDDLAHHRYAAGLAAGHRQMLDNNLGTPAERAHVEAALEAAGAERVDAADGGFDGSVHEAYPGVFTGHAVKVTKPGWVVRRPDGGADVVKAKVEPAGAATVGKPAPEAKPATAKKPKTAKPAAAPAAPAAPAVKVAANGLPDVKAGAAQKPDDPVYQAAGKAMLSNDEFRKNLADAWNHQKLFVEHRDGMIPLSRVYWELQKRQPNVTLDQFHAAVDEISRTRGAELHVLNEISKIPADEREATISRNDRHYHFLRFLGGADAEKMQPAGSANVGGRPANTPAPAPTEKPATAKKPKTAKPATPKPAASGYGTAGADHPLAGLDEDAKWRKLGELSNYDTGAAHREALAAKGMPRGIDADEFAADVHRAIAAADPNRLGSASTASVYQFVGKKYGLTKAEFVQAMTHLHDPETGGDRMGSPGASLGTRLLQRDGHDPDLIVPDRKGAANDLRLPSHLKGDPAAHERLRQEAKTAFRDDPV